MAKFFNSSNPFLEYNRIVYHLSPGDLIEIDRGNYKHWAICEKIDENGVVWCFHVTRVPLKKINVKTSLKRRVSIRYQTLRDILGDNDKVILSKCRVNNRKEMAEKLISSQNIERPDIEAMFKELHSRKEDIVEFDPKHLNCEHYVTSWKYGIGFSSHSKKYHKLIDIGFGATTGIGITTALGAAGLTAAGFTSTGIAGGSLAAAWQSSIGNVVAGSSFATLQSLGATGTIAVVGSAAIAITAPIAIAGAGYYYWKYKNSTCKEFSSE